MANIQDLVPIGILVAELREGQPLVYVNAAFETITGYLASEALGKNCRYLQGSDRLQPQIAQIHEAIAQGVETRSYFGTIAKTAAFSGTSCTSLPRK